jgi:hypothetical protein
VVVEEQCLPAEFWGVTVSVYVLVDMHAVKVDIIRSLLVLQHPRFYWIPL